jgi:hypothetical protein
LDGRHEKDLHPKGRTEFAFMYSGGVIRRGGGLRTKRLSKRGAGEKASVCIGEAERDMIPNRVEGKVEYMHIRMHNIFHFQNEVPFPLFIATLFRKYHSLGQSKHFVRASLASILLSQPRALQCHPCIPYINAKEMHDINVFCSSSSTS